MNYNKFNLCVLPTQMGKTFVMINRIKENLINDAVKGRSLHIVFTMNTLLNNKQFSNRLERFNETYGNNAICVFASIYKGPYKHINKVDKLLEFIKEDEDVNKNMPRIIIACSNKTRFSNCFDFVHKLSGVNSVVNRVFIYFDELHKYISNSKYNIRAQIENMNNLSIVSGLYGMTASPNNIWSSNNVGFWSKIKIINIAEQYQENNYIGVNDIEFTCDRYSYGTIEGFKENESFTINFIIKTLEKYPNILCDNSRVFIPVNTRRKTHNYVREHIFGIRKDCVIITINGIDKNIKYKVLSEYDNVCCEEICEGDEISIPLILNKGELGDLIADHIDANKLHNRPVIFIGFNCVGMGQTLVTEKLGNFTSAIFGYNNILNDKMYQLFGRITGRFKNWKKYERTSVYCTVLCKHISCIMEKCAKNIAINHNDKVLENTKYLEPFNEIKVSNAEDKLELKRLKKNFGIMDCEYFEWKKPINTIEDARKILTSIFNYNIVLDEFLNIDGYYLSKHLKKYYKKSHSELSAGDRLTIDKYEKIRTSIITYISGECKKCKYILLPVYKSHDDECKADVKYYLFYSI